MCLRDRSGAHSWAQEHRRQVGAPSVQFSPVILSNFTPVLTASQAAAFFRRCDWCVIGGILALLAPFASFHVSREVQSIGFVAGSAAGGAVVGMLAPWFRKRLKAGAAVGIAVSLGAFIANHAWQEWSEPLGSLSLGLEAALPYSIAFWDYRDSAE